MFNFPANIEAPPVYLGTYKEWSIYITTARGDEYDTLSLKATNGNVSFDCAFGQPVRCERLFIAPRDDELKKELDDMKERLDAYEVKQIIKQTSFNPSAYIGGWV